MLDVRLSHVFGKPRGRLRPASYMVYVGDKLTGYISTPVVPGQKRSFTPSRWVKHREKVVGVYEDMESAVRALIRACGADPSRPLKITKEPVQLPWFDQPTKRGYQPFHFDQCYYLGDGDDGLYWRADKNPDDGKWHTLLAVGSNTVGLDYMMDELGPFDSFRAAAEAGLQTALDWLKNWAYVDTQDIETIREDIRSRSTEA